MASQYRNLIYELGFLKSFHYEMKTWANGITVGSVTEDLHKQMGTADSQLRKQREKKKAEHGGSCLESQFLRGLETGGSLWVWG